MLVIGPEAFTGHAVCVFHLLRGLLFAIRFVAFCTLGLTFVVR